VSGDRREERQAALRRQLAEEELGALLVVHPPNVRYLTGFTGSPGCSSLTRADRPHHPTSGTRNRPPRKRARSAHVVMEPSNLWGRLRNLLEAGPRIRLGFEREHLSCGTASGLSGLEKAEPVGAGELIEALRVVKDSGEVEALRSAAELAQEALGEVLPTVRVGQTELEVAGRLEHASGGAAANGTRFRPSWPRGRAAPCRMPLHARAIGKESGSCWISAPSSRAYCADLTRTVSSAPRRMPGSGRSTRSCSGAAHRSRGDPARPHGARSRRVGAGRHRGGRVRGGRSAIRSATGSGGGP